MASSFSAQVDAWTQQSKERLEAVFHKAAEKVAEEVVARSPIRTGFLRHSFTASGSQMPIMRANARPQDGQSYAFDSGPVNLVILGVPLGRTVFLGFAAGYAGFVEFGARGRPPVGMVRLTAQRWPQIVNEAVSEAKAAVAANSRR